MTTARDIAKADWPSYGLRDSVIPFLAAAKERGEDAALVTLFRAGGGGPRGVGAQMAITRRALSGYLSGGCVEADVTEHALATIEDGEPRTLVYGQGGPVDIRLPCGGRIELLVERLLASDESLARLTALYRERRASLWVSNGHIRACYDITGIRAVPREILQGACKLANAAGAMGGYDEAAKAIYRLTEPRARLIVVGFDPTALAIAAMAKTAEYEVTVVRPKGPATPPPIADIEYLRTSPADAFRAIGLDPWTSVIVATHNDDDDHDALLAALPSLAGYVGLLGSRRHLSGKLARLRESGVSENQIACLKAPVGLEIGARSPWEIAASVMAEIVLEARSKFSLRAASMFSPEAA